MKRALAPPLVLVLAYGSNLRGEQMLARCPSAIALGVGRLPRHRLAFGGWSHGWQGGVATVEAAVGAVEGLVYRISAGDLAELDRYEGAPHVYTRELRTIGLAGLKVQAWVYRHTRPIPAGPSYRYFAAIAEGRTRAGLSLAPLIEAAERAAQTAAEGE